MRWAATRAALCRLARRAEHGLLVWNPREALLRDWQRVEPRLDELEGHMELLALLPWCRSESAAVWLGVDGCELSDQPEALCVLDIGAVVSLCLFSVFAEWNWRVRKATMLEKKLPGVSRIEWSSAQFRSP